MKWFLSASLLAVLATACSPSSSTHDGGADEGTAPQADAGACVDECGNYDGDADCGAIWGNAWDSERECYSGPVFVHCGPIAYEPDASPPMVDPDGNCWSANWKARPAEAGWRHVEEGDDCSGLSGYCEE